MPGYGDFIYTMSDFKLVAGYGDYLGIMKIISNYECRLCVSCFDAEGNISRLKHVIEAARKFQVPIVGENTERTYDEKSFE